MAVACFISFTQAKDINYRIFIQTFNFLEIFDDPRDVGVSRLFRVGFLSGKDKYILYEWICQGYMTFQGESLVRTPRIRIT